MRRDECANGTETTEETGLGLGHQEGQEDQRGNEDSDPVDHDHEFDQENDNEYDDGDGEHGADGAGEAGESSYKLLAKFIYTRHSNRFASAREFQAARIFYTHMNKFGFWDEDCAVMSHLTTPNSGPPCPLFPLLSQCVSRYILG